MKLIVMTAFLSIAPLVFGQSKRPFSTNSWLAVQGNFRVSEKWELQADAGHRRCDRFIRDSRQTLIRSTLQFRFSEKISAGTGFAWFGHVSNGKTTNEYRPFLQLNFRGGKKHWKHSLRLRNEWRLYPQRNEYSNRTRLQVGSRYTGCRRFQPYVTLEGFVTPGATTILESRGTIGLTIPCGKSAVSLFYTEQQQSTIEYGQHIIGIQYSYSAF